MWRELIATAPNQLAFREGESLPVRGSQIRVKSLFGAAKHGTELSLLTGTAVPRGGFDVEHQLFDKNLPNLVQYPLGLGNMCMGEILVLHHPNAV